MTGKTALLLVNTGSPEAPTPEALAPYLKEFLSDRHIVDLPPWIWGPILSGIIIPRRKAISAERYAAIWTQKGSPLLVATQKTAEGLQNGLGKDFSVFWAMCYGRPSVPEVLQIIYATDPKRLLLLPLFAQEASQTRGAVIDAVKQSLQCAGSRLSLSIIPPWFDRPEYIAALALSVRKRDIDLSRTRLIVSFHAVPVKNSGTYRHQCEITVRLLERELGLRSGSVLLAFQSKFGFGRWLEPSLQSVLTQEAQGGNASVAVLCPGFCADCLETLEEIDRTERQAFLAQGGKKFTYIPALNDSPEALILYARLARDALAG